MVILLFLLFVFDFLQNGASRVILQPDNESSVNPLPKFGQQKDVVEPLQVCAGCVAEHRHHILELQRNEGELVLEVEFVERDDEADEREEEHDDVVVVAEVGEEGDSGFGLGAEEREDEEDAKEIEYGRGEAEDEKVHGWLEAHEFLIVEEEVRCCFFGSGCGRNVAIDFGHFF